MLVIFRLEGYVFSNFVGMIYQSLKRNCVPFIDLLYAPRLTLVCDPRGCGHILAHALFQLTNKNVEHTPLISDYPLKRCR